MNRAPFDVALRFFEESVSATGMNLPIRWVLHENLCLDGTTSEGGFRALYNPDALHVDQSVVADCYDVLRGTAADLGFAVVCRMNGHILCTLIGDSWDIRPDEQPDQIREDWGLSFGVAGLVDACTAVSIGPIKWRLMSLVRSRQPSSLDFIVAGRHC